MFNRRPPTFSSTDFERGFIMAEVMKYDDLKEAGTDAAVKAAGRYMQKGKEYIVEDGDIIYFKVRNL
jgi:obg-like ATPase 1